MFATEKLHSQGSLINTENALDLAIQGEGFFKFFNPTGRWHTPEMAVLSFQILVRVVTSTGARLQPPLTVPQNVSSLTIGADGTVSASSLAAEHSSWEVFQITRFLNTAGLEPLGRNLFRETAASGPPQVLTPAQNGAGSLVQGALEASNVNVVEEMVNMIETQRAYEVNSKAISSADGMLRFLNQNL